MIFRSLILILGLLVSSITFAAPENEGVSNGGGGKAVICRNPDKTIRSAMMLDLFEAQSQYGLELTQISGSLEDAIGAMGTRLEVLRSGYRGLRSWPQDGGKPIGPSPQTRDLKAIFSKFKFLPKGVRLNPINDSFDAIVPEGCTVEQLAFFKEPQLILVDQDFWEKLDTTSRLALILHETIYSDYRSYGDTDSRDARKVVGYLLSTEKLEPVTSGIPENEEVVRCFDGEEKDFYIMNECTSGHCETVLQFVRLNKKYLFSKTTARVESELHKWITTPTFPQEYPAYSFSSVFYTAIPDRKVDLVWMSVAHASPYVGRYVDFRVVPIGRSARQSNSETDEGLTNCRWEKIESGQAYWRKLKSEQGSIVPAKNR